MSGGAIFMFVGMLILYTIICWVNGLELSLDVINGIMLIILIIYVKEED